MNHRASARSPGIFLQLRLRAESYVSGQVGSRLFGRGNYGLDWDIHNALVFSNHARSTGKRHALTVPAD